MRRRRSWTALLAGVVLVVFVAIAVLGDFLAPISSTRQNLSQALIPPFGFGGTLDHPLGTDQLGRDLLARIIRGARVSALVGVGSVVVAAAIGIPIGFLSGYLGGKIDMFFLSIGEVQQAFPGAMLALVLLLAFGPSAWTVIFVIAIAGWVVFARVVRGLTLTLKQQPFVTSAEVIGSPPLRMILVHLLPNLGPSLLTLATLEFAAAVLSESAYSFLGFGIQPPETSWGLTIAQGRNYLASGWWIVTLPGVAIALTVLGANLLVGWWTDVTQPIPAALQTETRLPE
jgi:peptide/nickel transport system permease protein